VRQLLRSRTASYGFNGTGSAEISKRAPVPFTECSTPYGPKVISERVFGVRIATTIPEQISLFVKLYTQPRAITLQGRQSTVAAGAH